MDGRNCVLLSRCVFVQGEIVKIPKIDEEIQDRYCINNVHDCVRYQFSKRKNILKAPVELIPC